jgi:hypothetical protein
MLVVAPGAYASAGAVALGGHHRCGWLPIEYPPSPAAPGEHYSRMYVQAPSSMRCPQARRLLRRYEHHHFGCQGNGCVKRYPDGWLCYTTPPGEWPWVRACEKGGVKVEAKVRSKIKGPR